MQLNALSQDYFSSEAHPSKNWFYIHESIVVMTGTMVLCCTTYIWIGNPIRGVTRQIESLIHEELFSVVDHNMDTLYHPNQ